MLAALPSLLSIGSFPSVGVTHTHTTWLLCLPSLKKTSLDSSSPSSCQTISLSLFPEKTSQKNYLCSVSNSSPPLSLLFIFRILLALNNRKL